MGGRGHNSLVVGTDRGLRGDDARRVAPGDVGVGDGRQVIRLALLPVLLATTIGAVAYVGGLLLNLLPPPGFVVVPLTLAPAAAALAALLLAMRVSATPATPLLPDLNARLHPSDSTPWTILFALTLIIRRSSPRCLPVLR